ncbi:hypothetical protein D3C86_2253060 [compost metagenome]
MIEDTKARAQTNDPVVVTITPMVNGVTMPAALANRLNTPPLKPSKPLGAISETIIQASADMPWAK